MNKRYCKKRIISAISFFSIFFVSLIIMAVSDSRASNSEQLNETIPVSDMLNISDHSGKVVYLDFWATWCVPCRKSFPWMLEMQKKFSEKGLDIILINLDKKREYVDKFVLEYPVGNARMIYDPAGKLAKLNNLTAMPTSMIIDRSGKVRYRHLGFLGDKKKDYEAQIRELIEEAS